ncbi:MAG: aldo/keto reductase [Bacteroidales bacterium]|nr:aldo/keto reductase [Bacteroidales bacterium]
MNSSSRRRFLKNATGLMAAGLVTGPAMGSAIKPINPIDAKREMIYRTLGRTGLKLPIVNMGVMNSNNPNLLKYAWQSGIRHFDTAWIYQAGNNEKMVGSVLREMGVDRKEVVITTKIVLDQVLRKPENGAERKKQFLARFAQSLERLQMDYVDILMIHDISTIDEITNPYMVEAMQELKTQGKIRFPGFSAHVYWPDLLNTAAEQGLYDVALLSINYSMSNDTVSLNAMKNAAEKGMGLIAMKTQCQQEWYKQNLPAEAQAYYEGNVMHSALLKWVLRHEFIATSIPGFTTFEQLQTDVNVAFNLEYTSEERRFLEDHNVKLAINAVCRFCGGCKGTCPHGVDIPNLMRTHMYASAYGNLHMTRQTYEAIEKHKGLDVCRDCNECVAQCRNSVQIAGRIADLKEMMPATLG